MQTEFTCGIYTAEVNECGSQKWFVKTAHTAVALIDKDGEGIRFLAACPSLTKESLVEIAVLMNNIKRQYKQLQTTQAGAEWQKEQNKQLLTLLKGIAEWPGNISDKVLQADTGPNDAALRGGLICDMRDIAIEAIRRYEPDYTPFK